MLQPLRIVLDIFACIDIKRPMNIILNGIQNKNENLLFNKLFFWIHSVPFFYFCIFCMLAFVGLKSITCIWIWATFHCVSVIYCIRVITLFSASECQLLHTNDQ